MKSNDFLRLKAFRRAFEISNKSVYKDYIQIYFSFAYSELGEVFLSWDFGIGYRISHDTIIDQKNNICSEEYLLSKIKDYYEVKSTPKT